LKIGAAGLPAMRRQQNGRGTSGHLRTYYGHMFTTVKRHEKSHEKSLRWARSQQWTTGTGGLGENAASPAPGLARSSAIVFPCRPPGLGACLSNPHTLLVGRLRRPNSLGFVRNTPREARLLGARSRLLRRAPSEAPPQTAESNRLVLGASLGASLSVGPAQAPQRGCRVGDPAEARSPTSSTAARDASHSVSHTQPVETGPRRGPKTASKAVRENVLQSSRLRPWKMSRCS
jgi:hypothetical protein